MKVLHDFIKSGTEEQIELGLKIRDFIREERKVGGYIDMIRDNDEESVNLHEYLGRLHKLEEDMSSTLILARTLGMDCVEIIVRYKKYVGESITV